jgi:hypothetical protein
VKTHVDVRLRGQMGQPYPPLPTSISKGGQTRSALPADPLGSVGQTEPARAVEGGARHEPSAMVVSDFWIDDNGVVRCPWDGVGGLDIENGELHLPDDRRAGSRGKLRPEAWADAPADSAKRGDAAVKEGERIAATIEERQRTLDITKSDSGAWGVPVRPAPAGRHARKPREWP